jgi:hypothetical protein
MLARQFASASRTAAARAARLPLHTVLDRAAVATAVTTPATVRALATRAERAARQVAAVDPSVILALFDRLEAGAAPVVAANAGRVRVTRDDRSLRIEGPDGKGYIVSAESTDPPTVRLQSTSSTGLAKSEAHYDYRFQPASGQWECTTDKHFLLELLTRDVVYHFQGVPSW